jgi:hypothetical protein
MKTTVFTTALLCAASFGLSNLAFAAANDSASPTPVATSSDMTLYNGFLLTTKIVGSHVKNLQNQDIGTIDDLIFNPDTGRVRFVVLSVSGGDKITVPWDAIGLEKNKGDEAPSYVMDANKDKLEKAPKFDANKLNDLYTKATAMPIFDYYSITFYDDVPMPGQGGAKNKGATSSTAPMTSPAPMASQTPTPTPSK